MEKQNEGKMEEKKMKPISIIKSLRWINKSNGDTCSPYGCLPYESKEWHLECVGFTVRNDNGTVGNGQIPVKTLAEAIKKWPGLPID